MEETKDKDYVPYKVIRDALRFLEIDIKEMELEYMIMNLFAYTFDLERLPYQKIFTFAEKMPSSPLLKSPSKRTNSFQIKNSMVIGNRGRNSVTTSSISKGKSNFTSMTEQTMEELKKTHELDIEKKKNEEIHSFFFLVD